MTRRLLRCYPGGSAVDKQPIANELSMLVFYLNTRPGKIRKCSTMICQKAQQYARGDLGNFHCTALIMGGIISGLIDHFPLFAEPALEIIELAIDQAASKELSFLELVKELVVPFNHHHRGVIFTGHPEFANRFMRVQQKLSNIASTAAVAQRRLAIESLESLSRSPALATDIGQQGLRMAIHGIRVNVPQDKKFYSHSSHKSDDIGESLGAESLKAVRAFLDVNVIDQIISVVSSVVSWLASTKESDWQPLFVAALAKWVPPQSRFLVTQVIVDATHDLPKDHVHKAALYSSYIDVLLKADDSKIGLSAIDVLHKLMRIQHRLIISPPSDGPAVQALISKLRGNIGNLVKINTYPGQTIDMIAEILRRYSIEPRPRLTSRKSSLMGRGDSSTWSSRASNTERRGSLSSTSVSSSPIGVIINDFRDLQEILECYVPQEQRKLVLETWEGTQWLLTSSNAQLLKLYVHCFSSFLQSAQTPDLIQAEQGLYVQQLAKTLSQTLLPANYVAGYYVLVSYAEFLNKMSRTALPYIYESLLTGGKNSSGSSGEEDLTTSKPVDPFTIGCRSSVGLGAFLCIFKKMDREVSANLVFEEINTRVQNRMWLPGITYPLLTSSSDAILSAAEHQNIVFGADPEGEVPLDKFGLTAEEESAIKTPRLAAAQSPAPVELKFTKLRASTNSVRSMRNFTAESTPTVSLPRVHDLRRRETDIQSLASKKATSDDKGQSKHEPGSAESSVLSMLDSISFNGPPKGSLTT